MDNATIAQLVTFSTFVVWTLYQGWLRKRQEQFELLREALQRARDVEDRLAIAATLATHTSATAADLKIKATATAQRLEGLIAENTKISTDAFHEANTVNLKLEKLGLEHNALSRLASAPKKETP
jgi:hypothetical protein